MCDRYDEPSHNCFKGFRIFILDCLEKIIFYLLISLNAAPCAAQSGKSSEEIFRQLFSQLFELFVGFHILSSSDRKSNFKYFLSEESSLLLLSPCNNLRSILLSVTIDVHIVISIDPTWLYYVDKWKLRSEVFFSLLNALVCCASLSVISFIYIQSGAADTHSKRLRNNNNWKKIKNFKVFRWKFEIGV